MLVLRDLLRLTALPVCDAARHGSGFLWLCESGVIALAALVPVVALIYAFRWVGLIKVDVLVTLPNWGFSNATANQWMGMMDVVVFTPIVETALMFLPIKLMQRLQCPVSSMPFLSALIWAAAHARAGNFIRLVAAWPFYLFTVQLLNDRQVSDNNAWFKVSLSHALYNWMALLVHVSDQALM